MLFVKLIIQWLLMKNLFCVVCIPLLTSMTNPTLGFLLNQLHNSHQSRILLGDYITSQKDKKCGVLFNYTYENLLTSFINQIGVIDLGSVGTRYTWCNNRAVIDRIYQQINCTISSPI